MIKEALQYIVGLGKANLFDEHGQIFSDKKLHLIEQPTAEAIRVRSISGLVDYLKSDFDNYDRLMIHVSSPTTVVCFSQLNNDCNRSEYIKAEAMIPSFDFDRWYDTENFNIKLQSCFVKNEDRDIMLKVVGNIKEETVSTVGDDGVSQAVVAKTGVATVANVKVPNPVVLKPYRTFVEVDQPESEFIFRMQSGPRCALFEADGGKWKLDAMNNIKNYLQEELKGLISTRQIIIIA
jgi:hypothetical protein